ncbi:unnamed protein product, partial [Rotaria sordida]
MDEFNLSSTRLNEIQNHEDYKIVWLSSNNNIPYEENIADYLQKYDSFEICDDYIKQIRSERIILLVLVNFSEYVPYFNDFHQIQSIYVFENSLQNINYEVQKYSKLINIFTDEHMLIERLRRDILFIYRNDLSINISCLHDIEIQQSFTISDQNKGMFLWNHVFIYYLVNSPNIEMKKLKEDMIQQSRLEYQDKLTEINDFNNNCTLDNALNWYTKDSFVFRLVNRAFRTRNIDLMCKFRYFIILLYKKLKELSIQQNEANSITAYRGQVMKKNYIEYLRSRVGTLISTNTLMSTTRDKDVARQFIAGAETGVIFEINTKTANNDNIHPFANISQFSSFEQEEEILFFVGTVFRIDSVEKEYDSIWIIKLTFDNETIEHMEQLRNAVQQHFTNRISLDPTFSKDNNFNLIRKYYTTLTNKRFNINDFIKYAAVININYLIENASNYEKLNEYYKEFLLNESLMDEAKIIVLNIIIGYNYFHLFEYDDALHHYAVAYSLLPDTTLLTSELFNNIGDVWTAMNNFQSALVCYQKALQIFNKFGARPRDIANMCRKISDLCRTHNNSDLAIRYQHEANQLDQHFGMRTDLDDEKQFQYYQNQLNTDFHLVPDERAHLLYHI